ncbi:ABC transporter ATP-binding protein (plasmid) [Haloferax mediterranei ATCC 33500]|uniref:ABC transporter ATP-binding protein n=1 Tax=Haloferax mediterranei (strain ATCC 33500 / DSM 1411 / JCM 8866 / NBRC 14739 / NCIMB 2177 / R-4) TaxID=523841 RepID=I3RAN8_HALMT|nr:ABC transporter ATP-binding protein [Haloferax mediterranei]AFK21298.1 ABC-type transport system ATP-binding protein [Haloferax mediterranei ATCC 33500]AHZ24606.1 ABC transporter ATP-binding protein [Haloferax mediterranei ATCC 33500]ELZ97370.1 ABC-type transport system ATP-binding protein [Haloferax mediterranei ATCC 33500]MDX5990335.1 ABC transporter ATP-binding protein [Haloferax mediterranei ATCC 33500]QCQ77003.1 ABC transporter ATP-binding protein [Haloferax mediterranei ATCC 33500]
MNLTVENLGMEYGSTWALRDISLSFDSGVVGLLGPNGAGKSTLMRIITTYQEPTEGTVHWNGTEVTENPQAIREDLGYLPQDFGVYPNLTAEEFLSYLAGIRGISDASDRIEELLRLVNLENDRDRRLGGFSGGMKQRVGIAQSLLADPGLLVVDEPTVGLDPEERVRFRNLLADLAEDRIVILSTHIVSDIEAAANDIALLSNGALVAHERPSELLSRAADSVWEWVVPDSELATVKQEYMVSGTTRTRDGLQVRAVADDVPTPEATQVEPTLEDAYLYVTGGGAR